MKKCFSFIVLILWSLSAVGISCGKDMANILTERAVPDLKKLKHLANLLRYPLPEKIIAQIERLARLDAETLELYLIYVKNLMKKDYPLALEGLNEILSTHPKNKWVKKFVRLERNVKKRLDKKVLSEFDRIAKERPELNRFEIENIVENERTYWHKQLRRTAMGCRSPRWTPERKLAKKNFEKFTLGIGLVSNIVAYSYQNRDKPVDGIWIGRLAYETAFGLLSGYLASKIVTNPENTPWVMAGKKYLFARASSVPDMFLYSAIFGVNQEDAKKKLKELTDGGVSWKEFQELKDTWEKKGVYQKFQEFIDQYLSDHPDDQNFPFELKELQNPQELSKAKREILMAMITAQIYEERKGEHIQTGDAGADRYAFHAAYGFVMIPKDLIITVLIYDTLCLGQLQPQKAFLQAFSVYLANRLIGDQLYYYVRRESINQ
jgi:hypothetical protein